jgi:single-stranded-DNA-specific exonuclease
LSSIPSRSERTWVEPQSIDLPEELEKLVGGHQLLGESLVRRGLSTYSQARAFLDPAFYKPSAPQDIPDLSKAADRLLRAIKQGETIGVWGDFDVDGQTSTTVLVDSLRQLGGNTRYYIPVRARESHGVDLAALQTFIHKGIQVVLTCDTGITAYEAAAYARAQGVDFIITDHHTLPPELPQAYAAVNPQRLPDGHPSGTLSGVGVAYKLIEELCQQSGRPDIAAHQLDLVALGTIADLALLRGDARYLVQLGLEKLRSSERLAVRIMLENADMRPESMTEEHIGFILGPRMNAIGRLGDANPMVEFLTTQDLTQARIISRQLETLNANRKLMCDQVYKAARDQIERSPALLDDPVLILAHPTWPAGVVGIVASRLVDLYHRPAILICTPTGEVGHGSARSVDGINITAAIRDQSRLLNGFGGHPMAAGLAIDPQNIPDFRRGMAKSITAQLAGRQLESKLSIDAFLPLADVHLNLVEQLDRLSPFGSGNPAPILASRGLTLKDWSYLGRGEEHLLLVLEDPQGTLQKVIWWQGDKDGLPPEGRFDLAYSVRAKNFRGQREIQLEFIDARRDETSPIEIGERQQIEVVDYRGDPNPQAVLSHIALEPGLVIWQEGENLSNFPGQDRSHLTPAANLVLWSIPPGRAVLENGLKTVMPRKIFLFGVTPAVDQPAPFLNRLAGLARYAVKTLSGRVQVERLACATAQREATVWKGLYWLQARGVFSLTEMGEGMILVQEGGLENPAALSILEAEIKYLLQETAAFRSFFLRSDPKIISSVSH